jgi:hypothetical protein
VQIAEELLELNVGALSEKSPALAAH